jgi:Domain of unknown function (DUF6438)
MCIGDGTGGCPEYKVQFSGDGRGTYEGAGYVDVQGKHHYLIRPQEVADLVDRLRATDMWSLRELYQAGIADSATYILTIKMRDQQHSLEDYVGQMVPHTT